MRALGYSRVSTHEQVDSGLGLSVQAERIQAYCALKGLRLLDIVTDPGVSGGKPLADREGGQRLLAAIQARKADSVVMLKLDRMFRNAGDCLTTVERWEKAGISLHITDLGGNAVDTTSAAGRFMLVVLAGAAEMERNLTRERTRSAMAVLRANGRRVSGRIPYGFDLNADGATLIENPIEQQVIADIKTMRAAGKTFPKIAAELKRRGIVTKSGKPTWEPQTIRRILGRVSGQVSHE